VADREPGLVVMRFVQAARAGDAARMRALLSAGTRASFGPGVEAELAEDFEGISLGPIVLSQRLDDDWAVGVVRGRDEDGDPAAFGAALRDEEGGWRLELGGLAFGRLRPQPLDEADGRAELRVEAQAGGEVEELLLWVDDQAVRAHPVRRHPFTREVWGRLRGGLPAGLHTAVVFATSGDTAAAFAWPFEVDG
jgi:hypothetical protein